VDGYDERVRDPSSASSSPARAFLTTRWSLVVQARSPQAAEARTALAELCEAYWYPLYAFVRRRGEDRERAADLTQGFFAQFIERNSVERADPEKGRFRAYLLGSLKHFMASEWSREQAAKRGGGAVPLSLDFTAADEKYAAGLESTETPESLYERAWTLALLERVLARLRAEYQESGRGELFDALEGELTAATGGESLREIGARMGMRESAIKVAAHRLRRRYRQRLRDEVAQTVEDPSEVDGELQALFRALGG